MAELKNKMAFKEQDHQQAPALVQAQSQAIAQEKIAAAGTHAKAQQLEFELGQVCIQFQSREQSNIRQPRQQAQSRLLWPELLIFKR